MSAALAGWAGLVLAIAVTPLHAQPAAQGLQAPPLSAPAADCPSVADDLQRLACFDRAYGRPGGETPVPRLPASPAATSPVPASAPPAPAAATPAPPLSNPPSAASPPDLAAPVDAMPTPGLESLLPAGSGPLARAVLDVRRSLGTSLADRWELEPSTDRGRFLLRPYKPMYAMVADWSTDRNQLPSSANPANTASEPQSMGPAEAKFQLSLKTKVWENLVGDNGDLWLGYTQTSYWQIYNREQSRPFRESNYEPEIMAVFRTDYSLLGWNGRMAGISMNHQSNGYSDPLSRSWNRVIAQVGFERKNWMVMIRPWWRISESAPGDNNPDIEDYVGRADLLVVRKSEGHELSFLARHSLRAGDRSRGSLQVDYAFPITSYLKAYAQLFSGYGASLIDYNHRQTRFGIGISLIQWL